MKALLRKELVETLLPALPLLIIACVLAITEVRAQAAFLEHDEETYLMLLLCSGCFGLYAGFFRFAVETWTGGWPHLVHRGTDHRGIFLAKLAAGVVLTTLASVGVVLVFALWQWTCSPLAPVLQWERIGEYAGLSTFGASVYAAGVLAAAIRRGPLATIVMALSMPAGLLLSSFALVQRGEHVWFALVQLTLTLVLLSIAYALFRRPLDRDLPLPVRQHAALVVSGGLLVAIACAVGIASLQNGLLRKLYERYPTFVRDAESGRFIALPALEYSAYFRARHFSGLFEEEGASPTANLPDYQRLYNPRMTVPGEPGSGTVRSWGRGVEELYVHPPGTSYYLAANGAFRPRSFFDRERGEVRCVWVESEMHRPFVRKGIFPPEIVHPVPELVLPEPLPFERVATKPGGRSFSAATRTLYARSSVALADPHDRSLWRVDPLAPGQLLVAVDLPEGDRFVALEEVFQRTAATNGRLEFRSWLVVGERGRYVWSAAGKTPSRADEFKRLSDEDPDLVAAADVERVVERRLIVSDPDAIAPVVEVRDSAGQRTIATHRFMPEAFAEKAFAARLNAYALLRPPLVNVVAYFTPAREPHELWRNPTPLSEPIFTGRSRPLLLLLHVVLALCASAVAVRSLRRRAAAWPVVAVTAPLIGMCGIAGFLVYRMLEPRSIPRLEPTASQTAPSPRLLLESA